MLGQEIRRARKAAKMTQEQLGFAAGVDRSYISQLENDRRSPTLDLLMRLCDAMGVSAATIVSRVEKAGGKDKDSSRRKQSLRQGGFPSP
jgi:transcriptional regulator with XRE-family HTH domain